jgi:hypothetical protein
MPLAMRRHPPDLTDPKRRERATKNERLARALRENLRRRKAQAEGRARDATADLSGTGVSPKSKRGD